MGELENKRASYRTKPDRLPGKKSTQWPSRFNFNAILCTNTYSKNAPKKSLNKT